MSTYLPHKGVVVLINAYPFELVVKAKKILAVSKFAQNFIMCTGEMEHLKISTIKSLVHFMVIYCIINIYLI